MKLHFGDLVDLGQFASMMQSFFETTGIPYGLIDTDNTILSGIGWQDICTRFHRSNPATLRRCHDSDLHIACHLRDGPFLGYRCANGLMDYATPVVVDGDHIATLFLGQLFHEPPDIEFFRRQAVEFGFDTESYLAALAQVPIIPKAKIEAAMAFFARMAELLAGSAMERLRHLEARDEVIRLNSTLELRVEARSAELAAANASLLKEIEREKRTELRLRRAGDFSQAVIDSLPGIFYLLDDRGRLVMWNRNMETLLGYSAAELGRFPALDLFRGADRAVVAERMAQAFRDGQAATEATIVAKDGTGTPHYFTGLRTTLDGDLYLVGMGIDITERVQVAREMEEKAEALSRSNAELEQFAYVASHDLREPLRMVTSYLTLVERRYADCLDEDGRSFVAYAKDGAVRMDRLVQDLLEYSRIGRRGPVQAVDSGAALAQALATLEIAVAEAAATVELVNDMPTVQGNADDLSRLFQNLIANAVKYCRPDVRPLIRVAAERRRTEALFSVTDNGIGIAPEFHDRIFMIFQRLHNRQDYEGTGIGLAEAKKIVECQGGRLWVDSAPGEGSTFHFTLPLAPAGE